MKYLRHQNICGIFVVESERGQKASGLLVELSIVIVIIAVGVRHLFVVICITTSIIL